MILRRSYVFFTLILATLISVAISMACSYWFFSSFMGEGYAAIGAGIAGCAIQLFGYGFSASFIHINALLRFLLCVIPLSLSMVCSYSALYAYLESHNEQAKSASRHEQLVVEILKQSQSDRAVVTAAAQQSLKHGYRNQAREIIQKNDLARERDEKLLDKLATAEEKSARTSPLDGLIKLTGGAKWVTVVFCLWLAVMFDILPVIAISVVSRGIKHPNHRDAVRLVPVAQTPSPLVNEPVVPVVDVCLAPARPDPVVEISNSATEQLLQDVQPKCLTIEDPQHALELTAPRDIKNKCSDDENSIANSSVEVAPGPNEAERLLSDGEVLNPQTVIAAFIAGDLEPSYRSVQEFTGWSRWVTQEFFKRCLRDNILVKTGKTFAVVSNVVSMRRVNSL